MARTHETHHKAAERHLDDAVAKLVEAKASVGYAKERNAHARAAHEAAIDYHTDGLVAATDREAEADEILLSLTSIADC